MQETSKGSSMVQIGEALRSSRLLNPEMTLREIVEASQKIPGLGESKASWELVTRDFVYHGKMAASVDEKYEVISPKVVIALQESKVINFDITLGAILEMSARIPGGDGGIRASWELVTRDFVLRGSRANMSEIVQA